MQSVNYSSNPFGRLFLEHFNDVRLRDDSKYFIGNQLEVKLKDKLIGAAEIVAIRHFPFTHIRDVFSFMICGKPSQYLASLIKKYYPGENITADTQLTHVVFHWIKRDFDIQGKLLYEWQRDLFDQFDNPNNQTQLAL